MIRVSISHRCSGKIPRIFSLIQILDMRADVDFWFRSVEASPSLVRATELEQDDLQDVLRDARYNLKEYAKRILRCT